MSTATALSSPNRSKLNLVLWIAQAILAAFYAMVGFMKVTMPIAALTASMKWPGVVAPGFVRLVGTAELAGALGLILPFAFRIQPRLTPLAAGGLVLLQVCAMVFHISRGEFQVLPLNVVLLTVAALVLWGRGRQRSL